MSSGACNACALVSGYAEGCDIASTTPVCDADSSTSGIQDSATDKQAVCVACKKSGTPYNNETKLGSTILTTILGPDNMQLALFFKS